MKAYLWVEFYESDSCTTNHAQVLILFLLNLTHNFNFNVHYLKVQMYHKYMAFRTGFRTPNFLSSPFDHFKK